MAKAKRTPSATFFPVYRFMAVGLGLSGTELLLYARIFSFCAQTGRNFYESKTRTAEFLGVSDRQVRRATKKLLEKGLIVEVGTAKVPNGRITKRYEIVEKPVGMAMRITDRLYWNEKEEGEEPP